MIALCYLAGLALALATLCLDIAYIALRDVSRKALARTTGGVLGGMGAVMVMASLGFASIEAGFPALAGPWGVVCVFPSTLMSFSAHTKLRGGISGFEPRSALALQVLASCVALVGVSFLDDATQAVPAILRSPWLAFHAGFTVVAEALFAVGTICAFGALVVRKEALRSILAELEERAIRYAFPLFGLGALVIGSIWAEEAWGSFWSWDPKECFALASWLCYALYLHCRYIPSAPRLLFRVLAITGFALTLIGFFGVSALVSSQHNFL